MTQYKQKLMTVEAFHYEGDFKKLSEWFLKNSTHSTLPFFYIGRELQIFNNKGIGMAIVPGCYVVLSADKKTVDIRSKENFEVSHVVAAPAGKKK